VISEQKTHGRLNKKIIKYNIRTVKGNRVIYFAHFLNIHLLITSKQQPSEMYTYEWRTRRYAQIIVETPDVREYLGDLK
jgi:hypothetical protein